MRGKVAVITGASGGIGEAIAIQLAGQGARLVLSGRSAVERCGTSTVLEVAPSMLGGASTGAAGWAGAARTTKRKVDGTLEFPDASVAVTAKTCSPSARPV